jgi:Flp pilus assembly protein TadD
MNQKDGEAHFQLANVYRKENNANEAAKHYNLAIDAAPAHAAAFNNLGMLQMSQDMASESVSHFKQAIALDNKNVNYRMNLAKALEGCQRYREATTSWEELLTLNLTPEQQDEAITRLSVCKEK